MNRKPCFEEISGFNSRWLIATGLPLASIMVSLLLFSDVYERGDWGFLAVCIPMSFVYTSLFWAGNLRRLYSELKWRYPAIEHIGTRLLWVFIGTMHFILSSIFHWTDSSSGYSRSPRRPQSNCLVHRLPHSFFLGHHAL